jgi:hypothetical protein
MTLAALLPQVQALPWSDKLQLMQMLAVELAENDVASLLRPNFEYRIESQDDAQEAAKILQALLDRERASLPPYHFLGNQ